MKFTYLGQLCSLIECGGMRIVTPDDPDAPKRISPIFVLPEFRGRGYAHRAIRAGEAIYGETGWELETILQEEGNCRLYENLGYRRTGETKVINDKMTLVYYRK